MKDHGGFEHNLQSLRVIEELEQKYPSFPGLNLTWETREGLSKHYQFSGASDSGSVETFNRPSLEAQVANLADEIAYYSHDLDDGLDSGLIRESQLRGHVELWRMSTERVQQQYGDLKNESRRYFIIRCIIDDMVKDVVHTTETCLRTSGVNHVSEVRAHKNNLVDYSSARKRWNAELREYLYLNLFLFLVQLL